MNAPLAPVPSDKFPIKNYHVKGGSLTRQQYRDAVRTVMKERGIITKEIKPMKNYALMNRKTGKITGRKFATRAAARAAKRDGGFKHSIYKLDTGTVIR